MFPDEELVLFKSDISDAYRNLPMHPLWQIKQINTIQGQRHVDRRNCFGGKGSGSLFIVFNSLVSWIGKNEYKIPMEWDEMESVDAEKLLLSSLLQTCHLPEPTCCVTCSNHLMSHVTSWSSLLLHRTWGHRATILSELNLPKT